MVGGSQINEQRVFADTGRFYCPYICLQQEAVPTERFFEYKNKICKNTQAEICPKIKNRPRIITSRG